MKQFGNMILSTCFSCGTKHVCLPHTLTAHVTNYTCFVWVFGIVLNRVSAFSLKNQLFCSLVGRVGLHKVIKLSTKLPGTRLRCALPWKPDQHYTKRCNDRMSLDYIILLFVERDLIQDVHFPIVFIGALQLPSRIRISGGLQVCK